MVTVASCRYHQGNWPVCIGASPGGPGLEHGWRTTGRLLMQHAQCPVSRPMGWSELELSPLVTTSPRGHHRN
jgi:hypothetical protein